MNRKLPQDAFSFYFSLGAARSYESVAQRYGVSKRAVAKMAAKEQWQERLVAAEQKARERTNDKVLETLEEMNDRHIKVLRFIQSKAIDALKSMPIDSAMDAVRAYTLTVQKERVIRGEPGDRNALDVEQLIKKEYALLMVPGDEGSDSAQTQ